VFNDFDVGGIGWALSTALAWYDDKALWRSLVQNAMAQDFSWQKQVGEYVALYQRLVDRR
jgi:glycogen synthase